MAVTLKVLHKGLQTSDEEREMSYAVDIGCTRTDREYKLADTSDGPAQRSTVAGIARGLSEPRGLPEGGQGGRAHGRRRQEQVRGHRR